MMEGPIPQSYEEWHYCITVECGIPLTLEFIEERLTALQEISDFKTKQFVQLYGRQYHEQVLSWFLRSKDKLTQ